MKNERILIAEDNAIMLIAVSDGVELFGRHDGHKVVGKASCVEEVESLLKCGLKPTVALVDNSFPKRGDGERAARIIKQLSPETVIISFSMDEGVEWGDENWPKQIGSEELVALLTKLQH